MQNGNGHLNGNGNGSTAALVLPDDLRAALAARIARGTGRRRAAGVTTCIPWKGSVHPNGIGWPRVRHGPQSWSTRQIVWLLTYGSLPLHARVYRVCQTPHCVNVLHMSLLNPRRRPPKPPAPPPKMTARRVRALREAYKRGRLSIVRTAERLGVHLSTVSRAARGLTYQAVA